MIDPYSISSIIISLLGLILVIPPNTCIVIVILESLRKEGKLSTPDVIFMVKGMVNILLQGCMTLLLLFFVFSPELYRSEAYIFLSPIIYTLIYFNFWMTAWLSAHYCTIITNPRSGVFICLKRILSNYINHILFLTALGMFIMNVLIIFDFGAGSALQLSKNSTEASIMEFHVSLPYDRLVSVTLLGIIVPFCLSLLCLLLTFSFLVRHVWRVKNNDSGSSRPNLQAHVTALRTIFLLLLGFTFICISQALRFIPKSIHEGHPITMVIWNIRVFCPSFEAAVIFQASNKLKRIILRRFWTGRLRDSET